MTEDNANARTEQDRTVFQKLFMWILQSASGSWSELAELEQGQNSWRVLRHRQTLTPIRALVLMGIVSLVASQSVAAQEGTDICGEGFGLMIFDIQMMAWQVILGALFLIFMLGLVLRAVPLFTGSTAVGSLMMIGPIVGVIAFIFFVQFVDIALGYAGGPGVGEGCSPFV